MIPKWLIFAGALITIAACTTSTPPEPVWEASEEYKQAYCSSLPPEELEALIANPSTKSIDEINIGNQIRIFNLDHIVYAVNQEPRGQRQIKFQEEPNQNKCQIKKSGTLTVLGFINDAILLKYTGPQAQYDVGRCPDEVLTIMCKDDYIRLNEEYQTTLNLRNYIQHISNGEITEGLVEYEGHIITVGDQFKLQRYKEVKVMNLESVEGFVFEEYEEPDTCYAQTDGVLTVRGFIEDSAIIEYTTEERRDEVHCPSTILTIIELKELIELNPYVSPAEDLP